MNATDFYQKILSVAMVMRSPIIMSQYRVITLPALDALIEVIKIHEPVPCAPGSVIMDCRGCDTGPHAEWAADAPCSTLLAIATALGVER